MDFDFNTDNTNFTKFYGIFPAKITDAQVSTKETKTNKKGQEYELVKITLDVLLDNETEEGISKKMFITFPFDFWDESSLLNKMRRITGLGVDNKEELKTLKNYVDKKFLALVGPDYDHNNQLRRYSGKDGQLKLSYNIIDIFELKTPQTTIDDIEENNKHKVEEARKKLEQLQSDITGDISINDVPF